jgi:chloramphenicol-sensitive protein RarD
VDRAGAGVLVRRVRLLKKTAGVGAVEGSRRDGGAAAGRGGVRRRPRRAPAPGTFGSEGPGHAVLLALSGLVTAVPLLAFGAAASRIPLTTLGLLQYLAPTIQFLLGITLFGEPLPLLKLVGFVLVWAGLALFTADLVRHHRRTSRPAVPAPA